MHLVKGKKRMKAMGKGGCAAGGLHGGVEVERIQVTSYLAGKNSLFVICR